MRRACRAAFQLRLSSACSSSVAGPSRSILDHQEHQSTVTMSSQDEQLIQRGEFYGVAATSGRRENPVSSSPELALTRLHENLRKNLRVTPEAVMVELVLKLENGNSALISLLQRSPERWIPMSIRCCGRALSSIKIQNRRVIANRLWEQIEMRGFPISIETINAHLRVNLDNNETWDPFETLKEIELKRRLVPDQETFHILLEKLSLTGETEKCNTMMQSYETARRGFSPSDAIFHSHLVYANAVRGWNRKADSLIEQAVTKFGSEGEALSLGAACVAAAAGGRIDRLRDLLRRSVDDNLQLRLSINNVFDIIWTLAEKTGDNVKNNDTVIEILDRSPHPPGFFRFLFREIERHISASHFRTSMLLLEETMRVKDALRNQSRSAFSEQMLGKMCRAMVKSRMETGLTMEIANRMATTMNTRSRFIHDELMMATLTLKDWDLDDRFSSFSSLVPIVDPEKERPHLIFPLLAIIPTWEERLKMIYRSSSLGYPNLDTLDSSLMSHYIFLPMYKNQVWLARDKKGGNSPIENMTAIIHSFGIPKASVWRMMQGWWKWKLMKEEKMGIEFDKEMRPYSAEIQEWLRSSFSIIFPDGAKQSVPTVPLTQSKLEAAIERGDGSKIFSLLSTHGWPQDVDIPSFAPKILELLIENESSGNIMKWLVALSREVSCRQEGKVEMMKTPLESYHMLKIMRHRVNESEVTANELIDMSYELKRLFPQAISKYDSYLETIIESSRLISSCFIFKEGIQLTDTAADDITEFLRTLVKLEIVALTHSELVTPFCVHKVLQRFGWHSALTMWRKFQSSFSAGNGLAILLAYALRSPWKERDQRVQFVLHKAGMSLSSSRIHSIHAAVLINTTKQEEDIKKAAKILEERASEISPVDCAFAYKLIYNLRYPPTNGSFIRIFPSLCLTHTKLAEDKEAAKAMLHSSLMYCETKRLGGLIVEMCDLFAQYGIEPEEKEKKRVENAMADHERLVNRWIFSPEGLIQARADQEFVKENEWKKYVKDTESVILH